MRVLIVDDEPLARRRLVQLLAPLADIEIVGEAENGREALELIALLGPEVILLDIEMPGTNGLDVLRALPRNSSPIIVFVTAYQDHAVTAFELRATDFVVKPVTQERLARALEQARSDLDSRRAEGRLAALRNRLAELESAALAAADPGLWVQVGSERRRLALREIRWIEAERDFTRFYTDGGSHLVSAMLGEVQQSLPEDRFVRAHRSAIVNTSRVRALTRGRFSALLLELDDGHLVAVGRKYRDAVEAAMGAA